jgi:phosphate transport system substrate-binding protein
MKKINFIILIITLLSISCTDKAKREHSLGATAEQEEARGEIQLSGAFALYPMVIKWAEEFQKLHPNIRIDISGGGAGKGITDALSEVVDIGMVSREIYPEEIVKGAFAIAVVKDAVLPTINTNNPEWANIKKIGLKREIAQKLWNEELTTWGEVLGTASRTPVHVFTRSDACGAAETFAAWLGGKQENLKATAVFGDPGLASAIQKDRLAIGYNNIAYAYDQQSRKTFDGLTIIPIDVNENGAIDAEEDFYQSTETLIAAINEGRYPSPPARDLYLVTKEKPTKPEVLEFFQYILTEGQRFAKESGYIQLSEVEIAKGLEKLK